MNMVIGFALVLGILVLVHEWGHFVMARLFGVRVDVFSIGFGPRLFGWKSGATDYRVSVVPLGGYVRMAGQDVSEIDSADQAPTGAPDELMSKPRWQRALISFAGPVVNLIFPLFLLLGYYVFVGVPHAAYERQPVQVTAFPANSSAPTVGLQVGDKIVSLNGTPTPNWDAAQQQVTNLSAGQKLSVQVSRNGETRNLELPITQQDIQQPERLLGFVPLKPVLDDVEPGMAGAQAGLRQNDLVTAVDGQPIEWWGQFTERVRGSEGHTLTVKVQRKSGDATLSLTPRWGANPFGDMVYQIGAAPQEDSYLRRVSLGEGAHTATEMVAGTTIQTLNVVRELLTGKLAVKQLQSIIGISRAAGAAVQKGPQAVIGLMVLISINLGVLNLLPIPILDGGNILLLAMEGIRRRDFSLRFKERFVQVGLVFLLVLFVYVMYNDVMRLLPVHT